MAGAITRWRQLTAGDQAGTFDDFAGFLLAYPGFPEEGNCASRPSARLTGWSAARLVALFDRYPPLGNPARAAYALALAALGAGRGGGRRCPRAWRRGTMNDANGRRSRLSAGQPVHAGRSGRAPMRCCGMARWTWAAASWCGWGRLNAIASARLAMLRGCR